MIGLINRDHPWAESENEVEVYLMCKAFLKMWDVPRSVIFCSSWIPIPTGIFECIGPLEKQYGISQLCNLSNDYIILAIMIYKGERT